jgi:hypothetical protein
LRPPVCGRFRDWWYGADPGELELCAEHGLGSEVELIAVDGISEAEERVLASDVRYRFVIDIDMLG